MKKAIISGCGGQDGSYLAELLLSKNYQVIGITRRRSANPNLNNIKHLLSHPNYTLIFGDITDTAFIFHIIQNHQPDEFYNLAAYSHVGQSFKEPLATFKVNAEAVLSELEAIRQCSKHTRFYQASSTELIGSNCPVDGCDESTPFHPRSPYGVAKLTAYWAAKNYREAYNIFACNGILSNHSSNRRGMDFGTRKITHGVAAVKLGLQKTVKMGNLESFRDEGHSKDFCEAMWLMLQQDQPDDYVVATGVGATMKQMLEYVCMLADLDFNEIYEVDPQFLRPSDVPYLLGKADKAKKQLKWQPAYSWKEILEEMYLNDLKILQEQ